MGMCTGLGGMSTRGGVRAKGPGARILIPEESQQVDPGGIAAISLYEDSLHVNLSIGGSLPLSERLPKYGIAPMGVSKLGEDCPIR